MDPKENPYDAPLSQMDLEVSPREQVLAPRLSRFLAAIIDNLIAAGLIFIILQFFDIPLFHEDSPLLGPFENEYVIAGFFIAVFIAFHTAVHGHFLSKYGQTIGKRLLNIQIVDYRSGEVISLVDVISKRFCPQIFVNYIPFVGSFLGLIDLLFIFGDERRCVHDYIAGTKVINYIKY